MPDDSYTKASGSAGIKNPKADPPKGEKMGGSMPFAGKMDSRPSPDDPKQSAK